MDLTAITVKKEGFTVRDVGDEILFLDPDGSSIHVADDVGGFIYRHIDGAKPLSEVLKAILDEYEVDEVTAKNDLLAFIDDLVSKNILVIK